MDGPWVCLWVWMDHGCVCGWGWTIDVAGVGMELGIRLGVGQGLTPGSVTEGRNEYSHPSSSEITDEFLDFTVHATVQRHLRTIGRSSPLLQLT